MNFLCSNHFVMGLLEVPAILCAGSVPALGGRWSAPAFTAPGRDSKDGAPGSASTSASAWGCSKGKKLEQSYIWQRNKEKKESSLISVLSSNSQVMRKRVHTMKLRANKFKAIKGRVSPAFEMQQSAKAVPVISYMLTPHGIIIQSLSENAPLL